jgi:hypothetical protein
MVKRGKPVKPTGRPPGWVWHTPVRCPGCGMTYRPPYSTQPVKEIEQGGKAPNGRAHTHVNWRPATCHLCGQQFPARVLEKK